MEQEGQRKTYKRPELMLGSHLSVAVHATEMEEIKGQEETE